MHACQEVPAHFTEQHLPDGLPLHFFPHDLHPQVGEAGLTGHRPVEGPGLNRLIQSHIPQAQPGHKIVITGCQIWFFYDSTNLISQRRFARTMGSIQQDDLTGLLHALLLTLIKSRSFATQERLFFTGPGSQACRFLTRSLPDIVALQSRRTGPPAPQTPLGDAA